MASKGRNSERRAGKRKDRNARFATRTPVLGYYLIVTDTEETEKNYFEGLKRSIPREIRDRIVIKVEKAKTTYNLVERTIELCNAQAQQRIPWIVFDRDQVKDFDGIIQSAEKNDADVYQKLLQYGSFDTAYNLAQKHLELAEADQKKPSEAYPVCTVHQLVKEIIDKVQSQNS